MKRPNNILETKEYVEPYTFENDQEAILFYAYLEQEKYIDYLQKQLALCNIVGRSEQLVCPDCAGGRDEFEPDWKCPDCRQKDEAN